MKKLIHQSFTVAALGLLLASVSVGRAQATSSTTTTTSSTTTAGTVSNFTPDSIVVQTTSATQPVSYSYSKTTTYVDENGNPVSVETVHSGLPVTVYYTQDGNRFVADRVVVRKTTTTTSAEPAPTPMPPPAPVVEEKKTTTTTTTSTSNP
jgi:hypothetical protein